MIDALLSLSRVSRNELRPERVDLSAIAGSIAERLAAQDAGRRVEVVIVRDCEATADPALARTLLDNLIGNAWKFTRSGPAPRIEFGQVTSGERAFFVRDNGAGFDMAHADRLFTPFQRLHAAREFPGTGIGLATAQRIVHRHGGVIWARGATGLGATFFFTLDGSLR